MFTSVTEQGRRKHTGPRFQRPCSVTLVNISYTRYELAQLSALTISKGGYLPFETRSECPRTRSYKARYAKKEEMSACCGKARETMKHDLLECKDIYKAVGLDSAGLLEAFAFRDSRGEVNMCAGEISKRLLEVWRQKSKETTDNGGAQEQFPRVVQKV